MRSRFKSLGMCNIQHVYILPETVFCVQGAKCRLFLALLFVKYILNILQFILNSVQCIIYIVRNRLNIVRYILIEGTAQPA